MNKQPRLLVACEYSAVVRTAFENRGWDAWSCDILASEVPGKHLQKDVLDVLDMDWDMMIAHPPCTYLCSSGLHWNGRVEGRAEKTELALQFVQALLDADIPHIAVENPVGCISSRIRKPDQYIQPYEYGHDASKKTGLWLKRLPLLEGTKYIPGRIVKGKERWGNQTDSGQNKLGPSKTRGLERAKTYEGIAEAMANQWGAYVY